MQITIKIGDKVSFLRHNPLLTGEVVKQEPGTEPLGLQVAMHVPIQGAATIQATYFIKSEDIISIIIA